MSANRDAAPARDLGSLPRRTKAIYALGDHTVNLALASMLFIFPYFLTDVVGMRPALAGLVPLAGRIVDAFTDPAMGRLSDLTRFKAGRRRPYFLMGMLPFAASFAALWWNVDATDPSALGAYYITAYVLFSVSSTVLGVPYLALIPEIAASYQERTSLNTYRATGAILGALLAAVAFRPLAEVFGGGRGGFQWAGLAVGLWLALPWPLIFVSTRERPDFQRPSQTSFAASLRDLLRHRSYRSLTGLYLLGRIAIDLTSAMFLFYFTWWLGRPEDFGITMGLFLLAVALSLPGWLAISKHIEKRTIFLLGAASWVGSQFFLFLATPDWPRFAVFVGATIGGVGYAAADMIPWSMLGEVVDEGELETGERREGMYFGLFMFLRKLGGAAGVALALALLEWTGYDGTAAAQPEAAVTTIRVLTAVVPACFVLLAALVALRYPLTRGRHAEILAALEQRQNASA